jgi:predicted enzyme related to lactoylglutathione lyase
MLFVDDPGSVATWWAEALGVDAPRSHGSYRWIELDDAELGFHVSDSERNPPGASSVGYLAVDDLERTRGALIARGAQPWRGPLRLTANRQICQVQDPFGNIVGLDGP